MIADLLPLVAGNVKGAQQMDRRFIPCGQDESCNTPGNGSRLLEYAKVRGAIGSPSRATRRLAAKLAKKNKKHR